MNDEQMDALVHRWGTDILRFCRITAGCREDGDELYQDTMLTLWEKRSGLEEDGNVKSYAIAVALSLWHNRRRKFARRLRLVPQESLEALAEQGRSPGTADSPEEALLRESQAEMVRQLVARLPEKYRLPLQLHYSADLPLKEIAALLALPENTVKSRLHRAKKLLRAELEEMEHDRTAI